MKFNISSHNDHPESVTKVEKGAIRKIVKCGWCPPRDNRAVHGLVRLLRGLVPSEL